MPRPPRGASAGRRAGRGPGGLAEPVRPREPARSSTPPARAAGGTGAGASTRRWSRSGWADRPAPGARLLARHAPTARAGRRAAPRARAGDPRRADQRARPARHRRHPRAAARAERGAAPRCCCPATCSARSSAVHRVGVMDAGGWCSSDLDALRAPDRARPGPDPGPGGRGRRARRPCRRPGRRHLMVRPRPGRGSTRGWSTPHPGDRARPAPSPEQMVLELTWIGSDRVDLHGGPELRCDRRGAATAAAPASGVAVLGAALRVAGPGRGAAGGDRLAPPPGRGGDSCPRW